MAQTKNFKKKIVIANLFLLFLLALSPMLLASNAVKASNSTSALTSQASTTVIVANTSPTVSCGDVSELCPSMLTLAYDMNAMQSKGINGTGQSIVIDDACGDPNIASDLQTFDSQWGLSNPTLNIYQPQGTPCSNADWSLETSLDVEWAHVVAPGATINLVEAASYENNDLFKDWTYALSHSLGNTISNSWINYGGGVCPSSVVKILNTATADHVTILAAAGDEGAWGEGKTVGPSYPVDCEQVVGVGGTTLNVQSSGKYVSESAWAGSGGGYVTGVKEPTYQSSVQIKEAYKDTLAKNDVSADANPSTGVLIYNAGDGGWIVVGGTSVACPLWAAFLADANQVRASNGYNALGDVVPFLYTNIYGVKGSGANYTSDFHDVKTGNNGWPAGKGWDVPTGIGTFKASNLVETLGTTSGA